jgi:hypothetical protein
LVPATDMLAGRQYAITATTTIILMPARLTATTDLTGLRAVCLSAPDRGMAGDDLGVGVVGVAGGADAALQVDADLTADVALQVDADLTVGAALRTVRVADFTAAVASMAAVVSTAVEGSTAVEAEGSTVVAVADTAAVADTGKRV